MLKCYVSRVVARPPGICELAGFKAWARELTSLNMGVRSALARPLVLPDQTNCGLHVAQWQTVEENVHLLVGTFLGCCGGFYPITCKGPASYGNLPLHLRIIKSCEIVAAPTERGRQ